MKEPHLREQKFCPLKVAWRDLKRLVEDFSVIVFGQQL